MFCLLSPGIGRWTNPQYRQFITILEATHRNQSVENKVRGPRKGDSVSCCPTPPATGAGSCRVCIAHCPELSKCLLDNLLEHSSPSPQLSKHRSIRSVSEKRSRLSQWLSSVFTSLCALNATLALFGDRTDWAGVSTPVPSSRVVPARLCVFKPCQACCYWNVVFFEMGLQGLIKFLPGMKEP